MKNWPIVLLSFALSGCLNLTGGEVDTETFNIALSSQPRSLDPAVAYDRDSWDVIPQIYETLYQYAYLEDPYKVEPLLAADMPEWSPDKRTVRIRLRHDAAFAPDPVFPGGRARNLKAADVVYSLKRLSLPQLQSPGWWILEHHIEGLDQYRERAGKKLAGTLPGTLSEAVSGIVAEDDYTVRIKLTKPYPQLLYILTLPFTSVVPREAVEKYGDAGARLHEHPVGSGPYVLEGRRPGLEIRLEKRVDWRTAFYPTDANLRFRKDGLLADSGKQIPFMKRVRFQISSDEDVLWKSFLNGQLDALRVPVDRVRSTVDTEFRLAEPLRERGARLEAETGASFTYLAFNMDDPVVGKNLPLRRAISASLNRERMIRDFTEGVGVKAVSILPPGVEGVPARSSAVDDHDPSAAKRHLEQAGYPGGKGLPTLHLEMPGSDTLERRMGSFLHEELSKAGLRIQIIYNPYPAYLEKLREGKYQVALGRWVMDAPDAQNLFQLLHGANKPPAGANTTRFKDSEFDALYEKLETSDHGPGRRDLITRLEALLSERVPWIPLYHMTQYTLVQPWVENYRSNELLLNKAKYFRINAPLKERRAGPPEQGHGAKPSAHAHAPVPAKRESHVEDDNEKSEGERAQEQIEAGKEPSHGEGHDEGH